MGLSCTKVAGHIPARISEVPSWDAKIVFIFLINFERTTKLVQEQLKKNAIFQHVCDFLQKFTGNLVE